MVQTLLPEQAHMPSLELQQASEVSLTLRELRCQSQMVVVVVRSNFFQAALLLLTLSAQFLCEH